MKRYKALLLTAGLAALLLTGCQKLDHLIPDDFGVILSLKQTGVLQIDLPATGTDSIVDLIILKGGSDPSKEASAELSVMTPAELSQYGQKTGTTYTALPAETYVISDPAITFEPNTNYQLRQVTLKTTAIRKALEDQPNLNYALPLTLTSATDSINADRRIIILKPNIPATPLVH